MKQNGTSSNAFPNPLGEIADGYIASSPDFSEWHNWLQKMSDNQNAMSYPYSKLEESLLSEGRRESRDLRNALKEICSGCFLYKKGCTGTYVSHAPESEMNDFRRLGGCYVALLANVMNQKPELWC